jgi:hypothetical protein
LQKHNGSPAFLVFASALVIACILFPTLGAYTYPTQRHATDPTAAPKNVPA